MFSLQQYFLCILFVILNNIIVMKQQCPPPLGVSRSTSISITIYILCHLCYGSSLGGFSMRAEPPTFYVCYCGVCFLFVDSSHGFPVLLFIDTSVTRLYTYGSPTVWFAKSQPFGIYPWQEFMCPGVASWSLPLVYQIVIPPYA